MLRALLERVFEPARLNDWFEAVTEKQYTRELLFSSAFELMSVVVFKAFGSVHAGLSRSLLNFASGGLPVSWCLYYATSATTSSGGASASRAPTRRCRSR